MSGDEDDYMSDSFLAKCVPEDVRPGLKTSHASKRHHHLEKKREEMASAESKKKKVSLKEMEESNRIEGLEKSLDSSNKGFAMLQKMGYKSGGLGKSQSGLVEPIKIEVKANRLGLGREQAMKRVAETKAEFRKRHQEMRLKTAEKHREVSAQEFRSELSRRSKAKAVENDLYKSQKACHQLDMEKGFEEPAEPWFWPSRTRMAEDQDIDDEPAAVKNDKVPDSDEEEEEEERIVEIRDEQSSAKLEEPEEFSSEEMLTILTGYLRSQYFYCLWCGITFKDENELNVSCPGSTKDDHDF